MSFAGVCVSGKGNFPLQQSLTHKEIDRACHVQSHILKDCLRPFFQFRVHLLTVSAMKTTSFFIAPLRCFNQNLSAFGFFNSTNCDNLIPL